MNIIIYGPKGCGKTKEIEYFKSRFRNITKVIDGWNGDKIIGNNMLLITNMPLNVIQGRVFKFGNQTNYQIHSFDRIMKAKNAKTFKGKA